MPDDVKSADIKEFKYVGKRNARPDGVDKVTGRAKYGADLILPGMLYGRVLRSPHAHAIIKSIDVSEAIKLPGVKAVVTRDDFKDLPKAQPPFGPMIHDGADITRNIMAREKALYDGHAVAAVAATSEAIAKKALKLIKVDYQVLPHVIDPLEAMKDGAPMVHPGTTTVSLGKDTGKASNITKHFRMQQGDPDAAFAKADAIVEREYVTATVHQGYIEPTNATAMWNRDGLITVWTWFMMQQVSPLMTPWIASGPPLYGTCCMLRPAFALNSANARCVPVPLPRSHHQQQQPVRPARSTSR